MNCKWYKLQSAVWSEVKHFLLFVSSRNFLKGKFFWINQIFTLFQPCAFFKISVFYKLNCHVTPYVLFFLFPLSLIASNILLRSLWVSFYADLVFYCDFYFTIIAESFLLNKLLSAIHKYNLFTSAKASFLFKQKKI